MEKLKQYKYIILIGIFILGLAFYWYEVRPSNIKKECYNVAAEAAIKKYNSSGDSLNNTFGKRLFNPDDQSLYYKLCLEKKGL